MNEGIVSKIAEWSAGTISDNELKGMIEAARPDLDSHQSGFGKIVEDLTDQQRERCRELIDFCFQVLGDLVSSLDDAMTALEEQDRNGVFIAGDDLARNSFQLNQAFAEFRNQALVALGPSLIPNYNLLLARREDYLSEPSEANSTLFLEAIDSERIVVYHSLEDLAKEPDLTEVSTLINVFRDHMACLNSLAETLESDGKDGEYDFLFAELGKSFGELNSLVPAVSMKLRTQGQTEYPDLNYLLNLMEDASQGNIGDGPLAAAMEAVVESFQSTRDDLEAASGKLESASANDEIGAILESFEEFEDGMEALDRFLEERDRSLLAESKGCLLDFAKKMSTHQARLKEIEEQIGKVMCPKCGAYNDTTCRRCTSCGGVLPQNLGSQELSTFQAKEKGALEEPEREIFVTANLEKIYQAVNDVSAGRIDTDAFMVEVERFENIVEANVSAVPAEPEDGGANVSTLYDKFEEGIESLRKALDLFRSYPETKSEETLTEAVLSMDKGARLIAQAGEATQ